MNESFDHKLLRSNKQQPYYQKTLSDEFREKTWDLNQSKMNANLNELIDMIQNKKKSTSNLNKSKIDVDLEEDAKSPSNMIHLDENSSTAEFRNYLEDLKKSYLQKLTLSCPSKLSQSFNLDNKRKLNETNNMRSSENIKNLISKIKPASDNQSWRRSLLFEINDKNDSLVPNQTNKSKQTEGNVNLSLSLKENLNEKTSMISNINSNLIPPPDLTKTQMLSRLVQIREYLKQAYTMLATLQTSNDLANYATQMNKLHSLIDNLKDQEKGYMDLLESFHQFTNSITINTNNKDVDGDKNDQHDSLDLTALNESISNQTKISSKNLNDSKTTTGYSTYSTAINKSSNTNDDISNHSNDSNSVMSGSFISDTLTLNCNATQNDVVKYVNKKMSPITKNSNFDDEKTDNDQDDDEEIEVYENQSDTNENDLIKKQIDIREQRKEIFKDLNNDLATLEQLREQKELLRSIRLRKEELKALEGRRKALEALKKIAIDSENDIDKAFTSLSPSKSENETIKNIASNDLSKNGLKELDEFNSYLTMLKEKNNIKEDTTNNLKTLKKSDAFQIYEELDTNANESEKIDPTYQIEKSKRILEHFEELMNKSSNEDDSKTNKNKENHKQSNNNQNSQLLKYYDEYEHKKELNERLVSLAENEKKLEELYAMQARLSQLKQVINHFNGLKDESANENTDENKHRPILTIDSVREEEINEIDQKELEEDLLIEHKQKLSNAKDKLRQLQNLISRLQLLSVPNSEVKIEDVQKNDEEKELDDNETKKLIELEELKQSKQKLIDLLKEKENESAKLAKLYINLKKNNESNLDVRSSRNSSLMSRNNEDENDEDTIVNESNIKILNDLENKFDLAEDDFDDMISLENAKIKDAYKHSPSDFLWLEMKKQLNMRENLRNKKKELEDLINNENNKTNNLIMSSYLISNDDDFETNNETKKENYIDDLKKNNKNKEDEEDEVNDYFEEGNNNDIINGYREFFLRTKSNNSNKLDEIKELNKDKISPRERQKQENICPPDELIKEEIDKQNKQADEIFNNIYLMKNNDDMSGNIEGVLISSYPESTVKRETSDSSLNNLTEKMDKFITNQQQLNETMMKSFQEFLLKQTQQLHKNESSSNRNLESLNNDYNTNNNNNLQFQTQIQIQQLMFNLNAAYHEISSQRSEMAIMKENIKQINSKIDHMTLSSSSSNNNGSPIFINKQNEKSFNSIGIATDYFSKADQKNDVTEENGHHPRSRSVSTNNALPSYFYNNNNNKRSQVISNDHHHNQNSSKKINNSLQIIQSKHETYYTDDFEEDDDENKNNFNHNNTHLKVNRTFSNISTQNSSPKKYSPLTLSNRSSSSSSSSSSSIKNLSEYSTESSTFALRKSNNDKILANSMILAKAKSADLFNRINKLQEIHDQKKQKQNSKFLNLSSRASTSSRDSIGFDKMREKIYSEVATLISKNEKRPFWLLNMFKELQYLGDKNSRDQALKSIFNISNRKSSNAGSFSSSTNLSCSNTKQIKQILNNNNNNNNNDNKYDDDDDIITYNYRTKKANEDEDNSSCQNPFENDSLSNTVIFVKNSPNNNPKKSPHIIVTQESIDYKTNNQNENENENDEKAGISNEVKILISKIISTIKFSNDFDEDLSDDTDEYERRQEEEGQLNNKFNFQLRKKTFKYKCDSNYLNNIIDRVICVLRQSSKHYDYLRLYQNQLMSYLREALNKYENKHLNSCMEDILIDISDILYNELTFYSIMNNSKLIKRNIEQQTNSDQSSGSLKNKKEEDKSFNKLNLIKTLVRNRNEILTSQDNSRSNSLTTSTTNDDEDNLSSTGEKVYYFDNINEKSSSSNDEIALKASELISKNAKASLDLLNRFKYLFKERNFNYLKSFKDDEDSSDYMKSSENDNLNNDEDDSTTSDDQDEEETKNNDNVVSVTCKVLDINDLKFDQDDDDVTKLLSEKHNKENEITVDDLPVKLDINQLNEEENNNLNNKEQISEPFLSTLDTIIMNSISDDLVGNPEELPDLTLRKDIEDRNVIIAESEKNEKLNLTIDLSGDEKSDGARSQKSESSNSDHFVIINNNNNSGGASDQEIIDVKKEIDEIEKQSESIERINSKNEEFTQNMISEESNK